MYVQLSSKVLVRSIVGCGKKDKYSSDNLCYLQDFDKLYDRLIANLIFEIGFNTQFYYSKIGLEDFNQTVAILKKSHWLLHTMLSFLLNSFQSIITEMSELVAQKKVCISVWICFCQQNLTAD